MQKTAGLCPHEDDRQCRNDWGEIKPTAIGGEAFLTRFFSAARLRGGRSPHYGLPPGSDRSREAIDHCLMVALQAIQAAFQSCSAALVEASG